MVAAFPEFCEFNFVWFCHSKIHYVGTASSQIISSLLRKLGCWNRQIVHDVFPGNIQPEVSAKYYCVAQRKCWCTLSKVYYEGRGVGSKGGGRSRNDKSQFIRNRWLLRSTELLWGDSIYASILSINESREQRNVADLLVIFTAKVGFGSVASLQTSHKALFWLHIRVLHVRDIFFPVE
jgi:hypothetical protein